MKIFTCVFLLLTITPDKRHAVSLEKDLSLTLHEKQTLNKFKEKVRPLLKNDFMKTDLYLIRWLRAKNFDVNAAEQMLKQNLKWREENKMDSIHKEDFSDMWRQFPASVDGSDKEGRPVGTLEFYDWNIREAVLSGRGPRLLRYLDMLMENGMRQVWELQQRGMNVTQWITLANGESLNMITHGCSICIPVWLQFLSSLENHYQGWIDELIAIELPPAGFTILNIVRPVLSRQTQESLKLFGTNKNVWMAHMDAKISRKERRAPYGGSKAAIETN